MGFLKGFKKWLFSEQEPQPIRYPIDEELIRKENIIKAQQQQIQARNTQLAKIKAEERERKESEKKQDYTEIIAERLNKRKKELRSQKFKHTFSLRQFFNDIGYENNPKKKGREIEVTDKDDKTTFGILGDFIVTDNGYIMVTLANSEPNLVHIAKNFNKLIWKPEALNNYLKRKRIPLAMDENMNAVPDLEEEEHPDIIYNEELKEYQETRTQRPTKELLIERDIAIREQRGYIARLEKLSTEKDSKIQDLIASLKILENRSNNSNAQLSSVLEKYMQYENKIGDMHGKIVKLTELKAINETMAEKYNTIIKNIMDKLEKAGDQTVYEYAKKELKDDGNYWASILPEKTIIEPKEEHRERVIAQPGQPLGRGG